MSEHILEFYGQLQSIVTFNPFLVFSTIRKLIIKRCYMKNMYVYICVAVMSYVFIVPSRAVSFRSAKRSVCTFYNKQPLHRKQVALGVPLLTLGIALEFVYGGKQNEIAERIHRLKQQSGHGTNKALKKQIRKLQLQRGGHIALQVFAALSSLVGGALTISAFFSWWNSMFQPRVTTGEVMLPGGVVTSGPPPGTGEGCRQRCQGSQRLGGAGVIRHNHQSTIGSGKSEYCSECGMKRFTWNFRGKVQSGGWNQACVPRLQPVLPHLQSVPTETDQTLKREVCGAAADARLRSAAAAEGSSNQ